ncbi:MAG: hypothetical protein ACU837_02980 [Gammaproteobacteria bacterium]
MSERSTTEDVVGIEVLTVLVYLQQGVKHLTLLLDHVKIHGARMKSGVLEVLGEVGRQVALPEFSLAFWHTPRYSPRLNPAEYLIHEVRRNGLYQVPCTLNLQEKAARIRAQLARG